MKTTGAIYSHFQTIPDADDSDFRHRARVWAITLGLDIPTWAQIRPKSPPGNVLQAHLRWAAFAELQDEPDWQGVGDAANCRLKIRRACAALDIPVPAWAEKRKAK